MLLLFNFKDLAGIPHSIVALRTDTIKTCATAGCLLDSIRCVAEKLSIADWARHSAHLPFLDAKPNPF